MTTFTIAGAFTALATFTGTVTGITKSYDLGAVPDSINKEQLPVSLLIPENGQEVGFSTLTLMGNAPVVEFSVKQLILYKAADNVKFKDAVPGMIALLDTYFAALKLLPFLAATTAPAVAHPVKVKPSLGVIEFGGVNYHAIELIVEMKIYL